MAQRQHQGPRWEFNDSIGDSASAREIQGWQLDANSMTTDDNNGNSDNNNGNSDDNNGNSNDNNSNSNDNIGDGDEVGDCNDKVMALTRQWHWHTKHTAHQRHIPPYRHHMAYWWHIWLVNDMYDLSMTHMAYWWHVWPIDGMPTWNQAMSVIVAWFCLPYPFHFADTLETGWTLWELPHPHPLFLVAWHSSCWMLVPKHSDYLQCVMP